MLILMVILMMAVLFIIIFVMKVVTMVETKHHFFLQHLLDEDLPGEVMFEVGRVWGQFPIGWYTALAFNLNDVTALRS